jgi:hypothetical protein
MVRRCAQRAQSNRRHAGCLGLVGTRDPHDFPIDHVFSLPNASLPVAVARERGFGQRCPQTHCCQPSPPPPAPRPITAKSTAPPTSPPPTHNTNLKQPQRRDSPSDEMPPARPSSKRLASAIDRAVSPPPLKRKAQTPISSRKTRRFSCSPRACFPFRLTPSPQTALSPISLLQLPKSPRIARRGPRGAPTKTRPPPSWSHGTSPMTQPRSRPWPLHRGRRSLRLISYVLPRDRLSCRRTTCRNPR